VKRVTKIKSMKEDRALSVIWTNKHNQLPLQTSRSFLYTITLPYSTYYNITFQSDPYIFNNVCQSQPVFQNCWRRKEEEENNHLSLSFINTGNLWETYTVQRNMNLPPPTQASVYDTVITISGRQWQYKT